MEIKKILFAIVESNEFWSDKCVRKQIKNPVDFTLAICRQLGLGQPALQALEGDSNPRAALLPARGADQRMERQGMKLLFPPDVAGWDWGSAWINSATMIERIKVADSLFGDRVNKGPFTVSLLAGKPKADAEQVVDSLLNIVNADVPRDRRAALIQACKQAGGTRAMADPRRAAALTTAVYRVLFAAPEFQFC